MTSTPGAATSGFISSETGVGPADEKSAIALRDVTAATVIASGALPGERDGAVAEVVEVVAGGDHRHDAGGRGAVDRRARRGRATARPPARRARG